MSNPAIDLISEYNTKVMLTMRAYGDLNVATAQMLINKQIELNNSLLETGLASSKELAAVKTPVEAVEVSTKMMKSVAETLTGFVQDSAAETLKARETLKTVIDDTYALNAEYAGKAADASVEAVKETANVSAEPVKKTAKKAA
jgi:hypothetical protein